MITLYGGAIGVLITVAVGWHQFGGPIPATRNDVSELRQEVAGNTKLILGDRWLRLKVQIKQLRHQLSLNPGNRELMERLAVKEQQLDAVNTGLKK